MPIKLSSMSQELFNYIVEEAKANWSGTWPLPQETIIDGEVSEAIPELVDAILKTALEKTTPVSSLYLEALTFLYNNLQEIEDKEGLDFARDVTSRLWTLAPMGYQTSYRLEPDFLNKAKAKLEELDARRYASQPLASQLKPVAFSQPDRPGA